MIKQSFPFPAGASPPDLWELNTAQVCEADMMDHPVVDVLVCRVLRRQLGDKADPI